MSHASRPTGASRPTEPWWREPTEDHWYTFIASWLGWTLDAFDFTVFLFLLVPILAAQVRAELRSGATWLAGRQVYLAAEDMLAGGTINAEPA